MSGSPSPVRPLRRARSAVALVLGALVLLAPVAPAHADAFEDVYKDFQKDGAINPCSFSAAELKEARDNVTPDIEQYAPDFPAAVTLAIESRANGNCAKKPSSGGGGDAGAGAAAPATSGGGSSGSGGSGAAPATGGEQPSAAATPAPTATPQGATPQPDPAPAPPQAAADGAIKQAAQADPASGSSDGLPAAVVGLGVLSAFLALLGLVWLIARALAWEPASWPRLRHACQEAGWRMSGTWADFTDWVRLGR